MAAGIGSSTITPDLIDQNDLIVEDLKPFIFQFGQLENPQKLVVSEDIKYSF